MEIKTHKNNTSFDHLLSSVRLTVLTVDHSLPDGSHIKVGDYLRDTFLLESNGCVVTGGWGSGDGG